MTLTPRLKRTRVKMDGVADKRHQDDEMAEIIRIEIHRPRDQMLIKNQLIALQENSQSLPGLKQRVTALDEITIKIARNLATVNL